MIIDGISYIPSSVLLSGIPKISLKDQRAFAVLDRTGEARTIYSQQSELGVYWNDTRFLSVWEMTLNGQSPVALQNELRYGGSTAVLSMTNRDLPALSGDPRERIPRETLLIRKVISLWNDRLLESIEIKNFHSKDYPIELSFLAGSRFEDVFEVRGFPREKRGVLLPADLSREDASQSICLGYRGLDGTERRAEIFRGFSWERVSRTEGQVPRGETVAQQRTRVTLGGKETLSFRSWVDFQEHASGLPAAASRDPSIPVQSSSSHPEPPADLPRYWALSLPDKLHILSQRKKNTPFSQVHIETDHAILNRAIQNAVSDIQSLLTEEPSGKLYPYAGIPWFSAPFGRDGMITALQLLPWHPQVAIGVLDYAFEHIGKESNPARDEDRGKIFHELRRGEMTLNHEVPFGPYFGSVDSTPLCLILLYETFRWTQDEKRLNDWWPSALEALQWIRSSLKRDTSQWLGYDRRAEGGLSNQGWKDSHDSVMHADGRLASAPIRLCEVQAYVYRALSGMSRLAQRLNQTSLAQELRNEALSLKNRFQSEFLYENQSRVALALDGSAQPCRVRSSNMGHCLWAEILTTEVAHQVAIQLLSPEMFSGHGVRTLASDEIAYNPMSYHNGSIWPHDNALILEGLRIYGETTLMEQLATGLIEVLESSSDYRFPELFCGFKKRGFEPPIPYEVACKPQAWSAASVFLLFKSLLGLTKEEDQDYLVLNQPILTQKMRSLEVRGLKGKDWEIDFVVRRTQTGTTVETLRKSGKVRILLVKS
jgi:glycogen debranching enzyme